MRRLVLLYDAVEGMVAVSSLCLGCHGLASNYCGLQWIALQSLPIVLVRIVQRAMMRT